MDQVMTLSIKIVTLNDYEDKIIVIKIDIFE